MPQNKFKIIRINNTQNLTLGNVQLSNKKRMIETNAVIGGRQTFAIAAISILPVSTPMFAINHEMIPETVIIPTAANLVKGGVFNSV